MTTLSQYKCCYNKCETRKDTKALSRFKFPWQDIGRCQTWVKNCANNALCELGEDYAKIKNYFVCEKHFVPEFIYATAAGCKKLFAGAMPTCSSDGSFLVTKSSNDLFYPTKKRLLEMNESSSSEFDLGCGKGTVPLVVNPNETAPFDEAPIDSERDAVVNRLSDKITFLRKKLKVQLAYRSKITKKVRKMRSGPRPLNFHNENIKTFVNMQLGHQKRSKWTPREKRLALSLYYKSSSAYKVEGMIDQERQCVLLFDEIK